VESASWDIGEREDWAMRHRGDEPEGPEPSGSSAAPIDDPCWTPKRRALLDWFERAAPALAPVYAGAVTMVNDETFPGRVVFVWHAIREIRNRLPDALAGEGEGSRIEYGDLVQEIHRCCVADGWSEDGTVPMVGGNTPPAEGPARVSISPDLTVAVGSAVAGYAAIATRNQINAERLFAATAGSDAPPYAVRVWKKSGHRAHKLAHVGRQPVAAHDEGSLIDEFGAFEAILHSFANRSFENMDALDEILAAANR
jgi:hypothetical protein